MRAVPLVLIIGALTLFASLSAAQPPPAPPVNHEFDFWIGEWTVTTPDGKPAGSNRIERVANGFGLLENWQGDPAGGGGSGKSLNAYDPATRRWKQFWVGSGGGVLELTGGLDAQGRMVLSGTRNQADGKPLTNRITWSPNADGTVRQLWEQSHDGGTTWTTAFDGLYRRTR